LVIYENTHALPRAFLVPSAEVIPHEAALGRLRAADFDPRATVLLERPAPLPAGPPSGGDVTSFATPGPNELAITTDAPGPAYLFLSEVFYPGWRASVDGHSAEILRANYLFRAVPLPAGRHEVRLEFRPLTFQLGAAITALTVLGLLVLGFLSWRRGAVARRAG
jgi:hypothetical protein